MRIFNAYKAAQAIKYFLKTEEQVDPIEWISDPTNILLENKTGDLAVFEYGLPIRRIYSGHYFFKSRGRQAIEAAKGFLDELFNSCYNVNVLMGMVPIERREVKWLTRQLGFKSYGLEETRGKQYELFILTRIEFSALKQQSCETKKEFNNE